MGLMILVSTDCSYVVMFSVNYTMCTIKDSQLEYLDDRDLMCDLSAPFIYEQCIIHDGAEPERSDIGTRLLG